MALPTNTQSKAGVASSGTGVRNKITISGSAPTNTSWKIYNYAGTGQSPGGFPGNAGPSNNAGPSSGSGSYRFGISGKPQANGIEKALGAIGSAIALVQVGKNLINAGAGVIQSVPGIIEQMKRIGDSARSVAGNIFEALGSDDPAGSGNTKDGGSEEESAVKGGSKNDWRVKICVGSLDSVFRNASSAYLAPLKETSNGVVFPYTPQISVQHKADYSRLDLVHNNFPFQAYKNSGVDDIQINGTFTVQTYNEGIYWLAAVRFFQTLTKSFYGQSVPNGFPPVVAQLYGYGNYMFGNQDSRGINVVVKTVNIELQRNVQYKRINYNGTNNWVPLESSIAVTVSPVYNRSTLRRFNLNDFANGGQRGIL